MKIDILGLLHSQIGPGVTPKVLPWDKKIIVPKSPYNALLLPPMVREHFSKKPKNTQGVINSAQAKNPESQGKKNLFTKNEKVIMFFLL